MYKENKAEANDSESRGFGVMGEILRTLQKEEEELDQTAACLNEVSEINATQDKMIEILKEINASLKEIAETQKAILEEIRYHKS